MDKIFRPVDPGTNADTKKNLTAGVFWALYASAEEAQPEPKAAYW